MCLGRKPKGEGYGFGTLTLGPHLTPRTREGVTGTDGLRDRQIMPEED